jgi:hypothetical protein
MQETFRVWDVKMQDLPGLVELGCNFIGKKQTPDNVCDKAQFYIESCKYRWPNEFDYDMERLIQDAKQRLDLCHLKSYANKGMVEIHNYNVNGKCKFVFGKHEDDYGGVDFCVNTVIYYLTKSDTIHGGDLVIGQEIINVRPLKDYYKVVCFAGDVTHDVTPMKGVGQRLSIVVQLFTNDRKQTNCVAI